MSVPARVGLAALGVPDVARATEFYLELGWRLSPASVPNVVSYFHTAGAVFSLVANADLAAAAAPALPSSPLTTPAAAMLSVTVPGPDAVDAALRAAVQAGATLVRAGSPAPDGCYRGYFADPDGHLWQVIHHPEWPLDPDGIPHLP